MKISTIVLVSLVIGILRFVVPSHIQAITWPGGYEAMAHVWVGILLCLAFQRNKVAAWSLVAITIVEILVFNFNG